MPIAKVALVTGAGSGIGRASAIALARNGFAAGLLGRTPSELEEVAKLLRSSGADVERLDAVVANASITGTPIWIDGGQGLLR